MRFAYILILFPATILAQMPYQVGWVYATSSLDSTNMIVSAMTAADTGGTSGHTVSAVVKMNTPDGRVSYGTSGWAYHTEAYTTASLCSAGSCYGGLYQVTSYETKEYCPITDSYVMAWEQYGDDLVSPFVYVSTVAWSPSTANKVNGSSVFTVNVGKSHDCTATSVVIQMNTFPPTGLDYLLNPTGTQSISFTGDTTQGSWKFTTSANNTVTGTVSTDGLIISSACTVNAPNPKNATLSVQP